MAHLSFVFLLISSVLLLDSSAGEDIPYSEYNVGVIIKILSNIIDNTIQFQLQGGFPVEQVVTFHCQTPSRSNLTQVFKNDADLIHKLDTSKKLTLIVHGYTDNKDRHWIRRMVRDIPQWTDSNACIVDWSKLATTWYGIATDHLKKVGDVIGDFILSLQTHIPLNRVSIVGHSLGAHVAGDAGARTGGRIDAIFGIDPAHPLITIPMRPVTERLDPSDAQFVQVIHTSSGTLGTPFNIGHQDWYADNGKAPQRGCEPGVILFDPNALAPISIVCSHLRGLEIFRFALNPANTFKAVVGDDMYGYWSRRKPGVFEIVTQRQRPYV